MTRPFLLAAAVLLLAPLAAAEPPAVAMQPLTLDNAACPAQSPVVSSAAAPEVGTPEPLWLDHCNATQNCPNGSQVSCQGHSSCTVGSESVTCDGVTQQCTLCGEPQECLDPAGWCECRALGGGAWECTRDYCLECWPAHSCA